MNLHAIADMFAFKSLFILLYWIYFTGIYGQNIIDVCEGSCQNSLTPGTVTGSLFCDNDCKLQQCKVGCQNYKDAITSSCQQTCSHWTIQQGIFSGSRSLQPTERQYCVTGCGAALQLYTDQIKDQLGTLPAPELKRETKSYNSVTLHWNGIVHSNVTYYVQIRNIDTNSDWVVDNTTTIDPSGDILVTGLHPYITYKFKILLVLTQTDMLATPESLNITTLPSGAPSSAPVITDVSIPTPSVASISWKPPTYTNGPLLGYRLHLDPVNHPSLPPVTMEVPSNMTSWTFRQLQSSQLYLVSISALNSDGEGQADTINITTPSPGNLSAEEIPYLILGEDNRVLKQNLKFIWDEPDLLTKEKDGIYVTGGAQTLIELPQNNRPKGIGLHTRQQLVVVSTSDGKINQISLSRKKDIRYNVYPELKSPTVISVDWLNNTVYIVSGVYIYRCLLDSNNCLIVTGPLPTVPNDLKVDPVNGFLYFTQGGNDIGLYRLDIGEITPAMPTQYKQIIQCRLQAFSMDYQNMQLYFPNETMNTVMSSFLDGTDLVNLRKNKVVRPDFHRIQSMVHYDGLFFWTDGSRTLREDYDPTNDTYYHNPLLFSTHHYSGFNIYQQSVQPIPVPSNPPKNVQALFTSATVYIQWEHPKNLAYQGVGAWNKWRYEVSVLEDDGSDNVALEKTANRSFEVANLEPDTSYLIKVRAISESGKGPWSDVFVGRTLTQDSSSAKVIMAEYDQINRRSSVIESDLYGKNVKEITKVLSFGHSEIADLAWHKDLIFWTTKMFGSVTMYNRTYGESSPLHFMRGASSLAYDWLGKKIYWSVPNPGVIRRTDISDVGGENIEFVILGPARHMAIDSINGRIYWVTTNSLESAYLNGNNHVEYFSVPYFSGKHVISLALNFDQQKVLWYVKGFERQDLYMSDLIQDDISQDHVTIQYIGSFRSISKSSGLQYYSHRIFWQNEANSVVVGDVECNYTSVISTRKVSTFTVYHNTLHKYPDGVNENTLRIIPGSILAESIETVGKWSLFNLTWSPAICNHGNVFYELSIHIPQNNKLSLKFQTQKTWYEVSGLPPYTQMLVTIRAFTYWGYGPVTTVDIHSPMSVPSKPLTPRVYVTQHKDTSTSQNSLAADFRWSTPSTINGVITYQIIVYWTSSDRRVPKNMTLPATSRHYILKNLHSNSTYYFKVSACTAVGCGEMSDIVMAEADAVNPVPKLLRVSGTSLVLSEVDNDGNISVSVDTTAPPVAVSFLAQDERMFWIDNNGVLNEWNKKQNKQKELMQLNKTGHDLTIDWISRTLYIVESDISGSFSIIRAYLLDQHTQTELVNNRQAIGNIVADPYRSTVIWTEKVSGKNYYMLYKVTTGQEVVTLFGGKHKRSTCNCPSNLKTGSVVTIDTSLDRKTEIMFYDETSESIIATDRNGCRCRKVISKSSTTNNGLPPDLLTVDHLHVYWYNKREDMLYTLHKTTGKLSSEPLTGLQDILAYGAHLQPLPGSECLDPGAYNSNVDLVQSTNTSITVRLEEVTWPPECDGISHPNTKYTIHYSPGTQGDSCGLDGFLCNSQSSYSHEITIKGLIPYMRYVLHGAVSNYYTEYLSEALGQAVFYRTKVGIPSAVRNVRITVLKPEEIQVTWLPPAVQHGPMEDLRYAVKFSTHTVDGKYLEDTTDSSAVMQDITDKGITQYGVYLMSLRPDHMYNIKVLVFNVHNPDLYTESSAQEVRTLQSPDDFKIEYVSSDTIRLSWQSPSDGSVVRHKILIAEVVDGVAKEWKGPILALTLNYTKYNKTFDKLKPNTKYAVRIYTMLSSIENSFWPKNIEDFIVMTKASIPEQPYPPEVITLKSGGFEVTWSEPEDNGDKIINYLLEFREENKQYWNQAYNGSEPRWLIDTDVVPSGSDYRFRVAALNGYGMGDFSENSTIFTFPEKKKQEGNVAILVVSLSFVFIFIIIVLLAVCYAWHKRQEEKKKPKQFVAIARGPDMELATLRELPHTAFQQSNTLYAFNIIPTNEDIEGLPHFSRDQLMLTKFLGSGAFGEVFEGLAKNILSDSSGETRVAVKTLRKSASDHEKEEFLKEALLMMNFKNEHILSLLGVCLDNDPQFIILELMEGGDLLSFLRASRPSPGAASYLCLTDLLKICVDVAKGCKYLEEMHFVHRDLAARNCLVSSKNPAEMVVKIGDFGLARDIYKHDYYRKEGEGLLPVRWMSPESLVDGVFTTQSDLWAFGVLIWEVLTFGQQPYPARTNVEVLQFVRSGGQLDQPDNCPQEIYQLMTKCWNFAPEDRPNFTFIQQQLEQFYEKCKTLLSDYIMPVRSRPLPSDESSDVRGTDNLTFAIDEVKAKMPHPEIVGVIDKTSIPPPSTELSDQKIVDGYLPQQEIRGRKTKLRTLSHGHDSIEKDDTKVVYRTIQHTTSFDSPEPRDTSIQESSCVVAMQNNHSSDYIHPNTYGTPKYIEIICGPDEKPFSTSCSSYSKVEKGRKSSQSSYVTPEKHQKNSHSSRHSSASSDIYCYSVHSGLRVALPQDKNKPYEQIHSIDNELCENTSYSQVNTPNNHVSGYAKVKIPSRSVSSAHSEDSSVFLGSQEEDPGNSIPEGYDIVDFPSNQTLPSNYNTVKYPPRPVQGDLKVDNELPPGYEIVDYPPKPVEKDVTLENEVPPEYDIVSCPPKSVSRNHSSEMDLPPGYDLVDFPFKPIVSYKNSLNNNNVILQKVPCIKANSYSAEICLNYDKPKPDRACNSAEARLIFPKYYQESGNMRNGSMRIFQNMMPLTDSKNYVDCNKASYLSSSSKSSSNSSMSRNFDNQNALKYWANNNVHLSPTYSDMTKDGRGGNMTHGKSRSQVYPENGTMMNGIDMVQASLV